MQNLKIMLEFNSVIARAQCNYMSRQQSQSDLLDRKRGSVAPFSAFCVRKMYAFLAVSMALISSAALAALAAAQTGR
jgi:hypothetical protein